jgi:hypothetical protein
MTEAGRTIVGAASEAAHRTDGRAPGPEKVDLVTQQYPFYTFAEAYMQDDPGVGMYHNDAVAPNEVIVTVTAVYNPAVLLLKADKYHLDYTNFGHLGVGSITVWPANRICSLAKNPSYG